MFYLIFGFCLYEFFNILTGFYLSRFLRTFLKSIPLFIKDLWSRDWEVFRGYGFWCYCGLGGSGKTISMVEYLTRMKKKYPRLKVLTNFSYAFSDGRISSWRDLLDTTNISEDEITEKQFNRFLNRKTYKPEDLWTKINPDTRRIAILCSTKPWCSVWI